MLRAGLRRERRTIALASAAASALLHGLWMWRMPHAAPSKTPPAAIVEFSIESPAHSEPAPEPAERERTHTQDAAPITPPPSATNAKREPTPSATAPSRASRARPPAAKALPSAEPNTQRGTSEPETRAEAPLASAEADAERASPEAQSPAAAAGTLDLSPRAAASTITLPEPKPAGRTCNPHSQAPADRCEDEPSAEAIGQAAQRELDRALGQAAQARPYLAAREPPVLKPAADGGYQYDGPIIRAHIGKDGLVSFEDRLGGVSPLTGRASLDVQSTVEKYALKREVNSAEKHWFLDQTESLRKQLADAAHAAQLRADKRTLEQELARIMRSATSPSDKRAAMFEIWLGCGDEPESAALRRVVESFIRVQLPAGSMLGYDAAELERLNRGRPASARFDPYATTLPG